ncbi:LysR family transcriptional regulator [Pseudomonas sp. SJZ103]|uniref:LysR family transcriptional regulator n=1 Tax=unclassified Pseudomonas TaxID=196821 RepID=UPI0011AA5DA4|nr:MULTISPECIES: LysR family transcriptional regulator [unclassified Pseudomonas]MBB6291725.1 DNA-binding transcriptional LysR family regulator [Pseudomonas sp. SJZ073]MBB6316698.1 DNA-binding transcriptional LysR family regulator [Pseudomonas sp. JAI120]TWC59561.1 LysR family transcriptional regulator [Pseudomonas sp. SJZ103]TWC76472.1 LysR family transcriptional regulator [Pseudomonas sp. SJZ094]
MALDKIHAMRAFVAVIQAGSFTNAARLLEISAPSLSRQIAELERTLDVRLIQRTTRRLQLTAEGQIYLEGCERLLEQMDELDAEVQTNRRQLHGLLRIAAPEMPKPLITVLKEYMDSYPNVKVEVDILNRPVDMVAEGIDLWIHIFGPIPLGYISRPIVDLPLAVCASPDYLARFGAPLHPRELSDHRCMHTKLTRESNPWCFERDGESCSVQLLDGLVTNTGDLQRELALAGHGIVRLPLVYVADDIKQGRLLTLLEGWKPQASVLISAVYPSARYVPTKVSAFVEFLQHHAMSLAHSPVSRSKQ